MQQNNSRVFKTALIASLLTTLLIAGILTVVVTTQKQTVVEYLSLQGTQKDSTFNQNANQQELPTNTAELSIVEIVEQSNDAVVSIVITKDVPVIEQYYEEYSPFGDFFPFEGGPTIQVPRYREQGTEEREVGGGTGFFVSSDGLIVTNKHVVSDEDASYTVLLNNEETLEAEVVARDTFLDIAILQVDIEDAPYLDFGNSDELKLGQTVVAIGNALGEFRNSVSSGVVSGLARSIVAGDSFGASEMLEEVIQTDAAINFGNSGGPLIDTQGNVIGINVAVARGVENIGFALPSNVVKNIVDSIKEFGEIIRPYIGVRYIQVTEVLQERNKLSVDYGALVARGATREDLAVIPGSPADKAGVQENDIILEVNGEKVTEENSLGHLIRQYNVGEVVSLTILSKGEEKVIEVMLEKAPE